MNKLRKWIILAIPGFLGFSLLYVIPFFESTYYSFLKDVFSKIFVWFANYKKVLGNEYFMLATRNTAVFLVAGCLSVMLISIITTLFGRAVYTRIGKVTNLNGLKGRLSTSNFIPFRTISLYIYAYYKETINASTIFENLVGNLLMFMPMGVFLPLIYKSTRIKHCVIMLLTLILVEVIQLITDRGIMDIDDIILNYLGFFMVYCIVQSKLFMKIKEKLHILL